MKIAFENIKQRLSYSCPFTEGSAVYKARSLYVLNNHEVDFDDYLLCENTSSFKSDRNVNSINPVNETNIYVIPNPANSFCKVIFEGVEVSEIEIRNMIGSICLKQKISSNSFQALLNIETLLNGSYIINVLNKGKLIKSLKLNVIE